MREPFTVGQSAGGGKSFVRGIGILVLLVAVVVIASSATSCVRTGHVGVVSVFGRVTGQTLSEGIHIVNPVANVT
jgi:regulator of protease activity HflC (stomatin/prohibitin superfamily)